MVEDGTHGKAKRRKRRDPSTGVRPAGVRAFIVPKSALECASRSAGASASKTAAREGRQEAGWAMEGSEAVTDPAVSARAKQGPEVRDPRWDWAEASIWTARMTMALENGVKGGKWFSLIDKALRPSTLEAAWEKVAANKGAAGVDGESVERFRARSS